MQISKLYETKLECSSYNVNIDSTDTTVTLTLVDFNGSPVTNTAVTLKADKGYFTKAVGKTTTTYTAASATKTINATTDNNGKVVATWTASEWGLCTFSANNTTIQIHSNGFREVTPTGEQYCQVWINKTTRTIKVKGARNITVSSSNKDNFIQYSSGQIISNEYYPETHVYSPTSLGYCTVAFSTESGTVRVKSSAVISTATACGVYLLWSY